MFDIYVKFFVICTVLLGSEVGYQNKRIAGLQGREGDSLQKYGSYLIVVA